MKFEKIQPGMVLYDVHSYKMGNTTRSSVGVWEVRVISVDQETRTAMVNWNGNAPKKYREKQLSKLRDKKPVLIRGAFGNYRRATREEIKAMKEQA